MAKTFPFTAESSDTALVAACRSGQREAFAVIVGRYQRLVASIAYSATGDLAQSEDLAQDTFLTAWQQIGRLREPEKLRGWLGGMARRLSANARRREMREPAQRADSLQALDDRQAPEALPVEQLISREEQKLLWGALERIPETYRETLVLYYREGQSAEAVAAALGIAEAAVRQRLARGRKLLEAEVAAFVASALRQSAPGSAFTASMMSLIPAPLAVAGLASAGGAAAKGGALKPLLSLTAGLGLAGFLPGTLALYSGYRTESEASRLPATRRAVRRFYALLTALVLLPVAAIIIAFLLRGQAPAHPWLFWGLLLASGCAWIPGAGLIYVAAQARAAAFAAEAGRTSGAWRWEYRSASSLLGLPLVHVRLGGTPGDLRPVKAWIAVGDVAFGALVGIGGVAAAPIAIGGLAVGLAAFAGFGVAGFLYAGFGLGLWVLGGFVIGWWAVGGVAVGGSAAVGGLCLAREYALGGLAVARHANDALAHAAIEAHAFFRLGFVMLTRGLWPTMVLATAPTVWLRWKARRRSLSPS